MELIRQMPWADVKKEMTVEKGLDGAVADKIGQYVGLKGKSAYTDSMMMTWADPDWQG